MPIFSKTCSRLESKETCLCFYFTAVFGQFKILINNKGQAKTITVTQVPSNYCTFNCNMTFSSIQKLRHLGMFVLFLV